MVLFVRSVCTTVAACSLTHLHALQVDQQLAQKLRADLAAYQQLAGII
jgi:hypothetical protein